MKRAGCVVLLLASMLVIIGVAGASDREAINEVSANAYLAIATVSGCFSAFGLYLEDAREKRSGYWQEVHRRIRDDRGGCDSEDEG